MGTPPTPAPAAASAEPSESPTDKRKLCKKNKHWRRWGRNDTAQAQRTKRVPRPLTKHRSWFCHKCLSVSESEWTHCRLARPRTALTKFCGRKLRGRRTSVPALGASTGAREEPAAAPTLVRRRCRQPYHSPPAASANPPPAHAAMIGMSGGPLAGSSRTVVRDALSVGGGSSL